MISDELFAELRWIAQAMMSAHSTEVDNTSAVLLGGVERKHIMELGIALSAIVFGHEAKIIFRQHRKPSMVDAHVRAATLYWGFRMSDPQESDKAAIKRVRAAVEEMAERKDSYIIKLARKHQKVAIKKLEFFTRDESTRHMLDDLKNYLRKKRPHMRDVDG